MVSPKVKAFAIVFALFLLVGIVTAGCKQKSKDTWVNTNSMPGKTFSGYTNQSNANIGHSGIVYLGSDDNAPNVNFGPKDVSFKFRDLNR